MSLNIPGLAGSLISVSEEKADPADIDYVARDERLNPDPSLIPDPADLGPGRVRSEAELKEVAEAAAEELADASTDEILAWAAETFGNRLAVACSRPPTRACPRSPAGLPPGRAPRPLPRAPPAAA